MKNENLPEDWKMITAFYLMPQIANLVAWLLVGLAISVPFYPFTLFWAGAWFFMSSMASARYLWISRREKNQS